MFEVRVAVSKLSAWLPEVPGVTYQSRAKDGTLDSSDRAFPLNLR